MLLAEVLTRKRNLEDKVAGLEDHLVSLALDDSIQDSSEVDGVVSTIYALIDEHQQQVFTIDRANKSIEIKIGSSTTTLAAAIRLREAIKRKMDVLSSLIDACKRSKNSKFSITDLLDNKDKLIVEYDILTATIKSKDWTVELTE